MKTQIKKRLGLILLIALTINVSAQSKEERKTKKQKAYMECAQLIESGAFKFEAEKAYPQGSSSIDLTTNYGFIKVSETNSLCDLPYFGRAFSVEYGGDAGIHFDGNIFDEKMTRDDKKMKVTYTYKVKDKEPFTVIIEAFSKESASVLIRCNSKAHITYSGQLTELKKAKTKRQ